MLKRGLLILLLAATTQAFSAGFPGNSADDILPDEKRKPRQAAWLSVSQFLFQEKQLGYEREMLPGLSVEATFGYKAPSRKGTPYDLSMRSIGPAHYYDYIAQIPFSTGLYGSMALKKYFKEMPGLYVSGVFFYRHWFFRNQQLNSSEMVRGTPNTFDANMNLEMDVIGGKLLLGHAFDLVPFSESKAIVADYYFGLGYRQKNVNATPASGSQGPLHYPFGKDQKSAAVSVHLGVKIGFRF